MIRVTASFVDGNAPTSRFEGTDSFDEEESRGADRTTRTKASLLHSVRSNVFVLVVVIRDVQDHRAYPLCQELCKVEVIASRRWLWDHQAVSLERRAHEQIVHGSNLGLSRESK